MSCNKCNKSYCNCASKLSKCNTSCTGGCDCIVRYTGPDIDCLGISNRDSFDQVMSTLSQFVCNINFEDGVGISNIVDNEDGTFTINLTDGSSFTTSDLTGPQGDPGEDADCDCCNFNVDISFVEYLGAGDTVPSFNYTVNGGTAPYTVQWSIPDLVQMYNITGSSTDDTVILTEVESSFIDACGPGADGIYRTTLLKAIITDANGCKAKDFFRVSQLICPT